jgi:predicted phage terminase large subunit-like protein
VPPHNPFTDESVDLYVRYLQLRARHDFATFRQLKRPTMAWGWWIEEVARQLMHFYRDLSEGRRPKLVLMSPPQHGKTITIWDFIAWISGRHPDLRTIFASYSDDLGIAANADLQRTIRSPLYSRIFPGTRIDAPDRQCNSGLIEFADRLGSFRNTTVNGAINGFGLDLGIIDDPIKGRQEAESKRIRDSTWNWLVDDFFNRFSDRAGLLILATRWHVDDPIGRFLEKFGDAVRILCYPAIAEADEFDETGGLLRRKGEALFAEFKPLDFLLERKTLESQASWESLFQQHPIVAGGGQLPIANLRVLALDRSLIAASVRYWDKAATPDDDNAAYTAGVLMHKLKDGRYVIEDVARGRWGALDREMRIKAVTQADAKTCANYEVVIEQEPGSGGKESAEATIRNLAGYRVRADKVTGSKVERAQPFVAQVQGGNVWLAPGDFVPAFRDECETWPYGKYKDQVDAAVGAFNQVVSLTRYNLDYPSWAY